MPRKIHPCIPNYAKSRKKPASHILEPLLVFPFLWYDTKYDWSQKHLDFREDDKNVSLLQLLLAQYFQLVPAVLQCLLLFWILVLHFFHYTEQHVTPNEACSGKLLCVYSIDPAAPKLTSDTFVKACNLLFTIPPHHTTVNERKRVARCNFNSFPNHIKWAQNLMVILEGESSFSLESEELRLLKLISTFIQWSWVTQQQNTYSILTQEPKTSPL